MDFRDLIPWTRPGALGRTAGGDAFATLQAEINRMFEETLRDWSGHTPAVFARGTAWPTLAIKENDTAYVVTVELPGLDEKDVEVSVEDDMLVIKGEKKSETTDETKHFSEHFYGSFERMVPVGTDVDRDKVAGAFKNGVLTLILPKTKVAKPEARKVPLAAV
jgi:HSP20 family protein